MSHSLQPNYTDTAVSGVSSLTLPRAVLNFEKDFRVKTDEENEVILCNITSPLDRPETIRFAYSELSNIYGNTSIDQSVYAPSKKGISVLCQINDVLSYQDSSDPSAVRYDLPISAHLVIKFPASDVISAENLQTVVGRLVSTLFDTGSTANTRLSQLMRGSLTPSDI